MIIIIDHQGKRDGDIFLQHFSVSSETAIHHNAKHNEAYDSVTTMTGGTLHTNVAYEATRQIKPGLSNARGLKTNVAYDITVDAVCDAAKQLYNEDRVYDTIITS